MKKRFASIAVVLSVLLAGLFGATNATPIHAAAAHVSTHQEGGTAPGFRPFANWQRHPHWNEKSFFLAGIPRSRNAIARALGLNADRIEIHWFGTSPEFQKAFGVKKVIDQIWTRPPRGNEPPCTTWRVNPGGAIDSQPPGYQGATYTGKYYPINTGGYRAVSGSVTAQVMTWDPWLNEATLSSHRFAWPGHGAGSCSGSGNGSLPNYGATPTPGSNPQPQPQPTYPPGNTGSGTGNNNTGQTGSGNWETFHCSWLLSHFPQNFGDVKALGARIYGVDASRIRPLQMFCASGTSPYDGFAVLGPNEGFSGTVRATVPAGGAIDSYFTQDGAVYTGNDTVVVNQERDAQGNLLPHGTIRAYNGDVIATTESWYPCASERQTCANAVMASYGYGSSSAGTGSNAGTGNLNGLPTVNGQICVTGTTLANAMKWPLYSDQGDTATYGGARVNIPANSTLPDGWQWVGDGTTSPTHGGVISIYPPDNVPCRSSIGAQA